MKKALLALAAVAMASSALADATIQFKQRTIDKKDPTQGTYDVPIWTEFGVGSTGAGTLPGGATVGLFFNGIMLASTPMRTTSSQQFFAISSQGVTVPGVNPGSIQSFTVREWQGTGGFEAAKNSGLAWGEQTFTSKPLGGTDANGNIITTPSMTGWGPESGVGVILPYQVPEPAIIAFGAIGLGVLFLRRGTYPGHQGRLRQ